METLFGTLDPSPPRRQRTVGPFAAVALDQAIDRLLDYSIPPRLAATLRPGQVVKVPLGRSNKPTRGYVVDIHDTSDYPKIKPVASIEDDRVLINPKRMELSRWMSRYYVSPLGTVLDSVIPSAVRKRIGLSYNQMVRLNQPREAVQAATEATKAPKRRAVLARLLLLDPGHSIELNRLAAEAGTTPPTVRKLLRQRLITILPEADVSRLTSSLLDKGGGEPQLTLNEEQQKAMDQLIPALAGGFSINLLHGVTGSGKTEIYLHCIREVLAAGKEAIVLVPEIALTPQTVRRFTARFKGVAILHSGLSAGERHRYWQQIANGSARVVVGARSAIFAPVPNLGIIVVDEEHDASYKQDQSPRYNAHDVAIKRGQLEGVPVILGSATPSLESWNRVVRVSGPGSRVSGKADTEVSDAASSPQTPDPKPETLKSKPQARLISLPNRVRGLSLANVELIDMKQEARMQRGINLISRRLDYLLRNTLAAKQQAILLLNRRGYSNFVYCVSCQNAIQCKFCDTTMTYHRAADAHAKGASNAEGVHTGHLHCHYCLAVNPLPDKCPACGKKLSLFGLGTQRVEEELARKFPGIVFARVDSDSMRRGKDYERLLDRFARGEIQVLLGTQMIAKGLDYPNVTLVGVISGDTALSLPDFRAGERTFQLITQVAGRGRRGDAGGRVILQTFMPDDPTIRAAIRQDFVGFAKAELQQREEVGLPPFERMVRIVLRDQDPDRLLQHSETLATELAQAVSLEAGRVRMKGPMPCPINRIAGHFRNQIVLSSPEASRLQRVLAQVREKGALAKNERIAVDVDPVSLL